jgi:hypothetical protein
MVTPSEIVLKPKSRETLPDKSELATIAPGEKPDHIGAEELKYLEPLDNLS